MDHLVLRDGLGNLYCGKCFSTRSAKGLPWANDQAVRAHLKHCRGKQGLEDRKAALLSRLAGSSPVVPPPVPVLPQVLPEESAGQLLVEVEQNQLLYLDKQRIGVMKIFDRLWPEIQQMKDRG